MSWQKFDKHRSENKFQDVIAELNTCDFDILLASESECSWPQKGLKWWLMLQERCWYWVFAEIVGSNVRSGNFMVA